jgi:LacI family repressor for deo operon, udp, cdd, tsx, nupC, and nupG
VFEAASSLGFQLNQQAVDFRRGRSNAIIVLVSDISNPFYSVFFAAIEAEARRHGFIVLIGDTASDTASEETYTAMLLAGKADGIISNVGRFPRGLVAPIDGHYSGPPIVACNHDAGPGVPTTRIDNYQAGKTVGRHLAQLGHVRLAQVHGELRHDDYVGRYQGFLDGLAEFGVRQEPQTRRSDPLAATSAAQLRLLQGPMPGEAKPVERRVPLPLLHEVGSRWR